MTPIDLRTPAACVTMSKPLTFLPRQPDAGPRLLRRRGGLLSAKL